VQLKRRVTNITLLHFAFHTSYRLFFSRSYYDSQHTGKKFLISKHKLANFEFPGKPLRKPNFLLTLLVKVPLIFVENPNVWQPYICIFFTSSNSTSHNQIAEITFCNHRLKLNVAEMYIFHNSIVKNKRSTNFIGDIGICSCWI